MSCVDDTMCENVARERKIRGLAERTLKLATKLGGVVDSILDQLYGPEADNVPGDTRANAPSLLDALEQTHQVLSAVMESVNRIAGDL